jgi:hypothetical protein
MSITGRIIWAVGAAIIGVIGGLVVNYEHSFQKVTVTVDAGLHAQIYKDLGGDGAYNYKASSTPVASLSSSQTIKLRDGTYDAVVSDPSHEYENPVIKIVVTPGTNSASISPTYTTTKLAALLTNEQPAILQALNAKYPTLSGLYTVSNGQLYERGDWFGAELVPSNPSDDLLRVILHEEDGTWKVATDPPQISIGEPSNTDIPSDVIESVDQLGNGS